MLGSRWCIYHTVMNLQPKGVISLILATLSLHTMFMISSARAIYCPGKLADTEDMNRERTHGCLRNHTCVQSELPLESRGKGHNASIAAKKVQDIYADHFMNEVAVDWQCEKC